MRNKSIIEVRGRLLILIRDAKTGIIKPRKCRLIDNLVVDTGLAFIAASLVPDGSGFQYCAVGYDNTAPANDDTILGNEFDRVQNSYIFQEDNAIIVDSFFETGDGNPVGPNQLVEAGLFGYDATASADSGWLITRTVFDPISKTSSETMIISWSLSFNRG